VEFSQQDLDPSFSATRTGKCGAGPGHLLWVSVQRKKKFSKMERWGSEGLSLDARAISQWTLTTDSPLADFLLWVTLFSSLATCPCYNINGYTPMDKHVHHEENETSS
jgi:hypothetical protein